MSFATKVIVPGVVGKAVLMGTLVSVLAVTSFGKSLILVLVSATATGIFGILIVLIQVHSERAIHKRMDKLEESTQTAVTQAKDEVTSKTDEAVATVTQQITEAVTSTETK